LPEAQAGVAPRAIWSGTLTFGLVSIPVDLFAAQRSLKARMRMLAEDGTPLRRVYFCSKEERELEPDEIVRGFEIEEDRFVVITDDELEALEPAKSRDIHLRRFVPRAALPSAHFRRAYYLAPSGQSTRAYAVLAHTMEQSDRAGIATFVMRGKEYLVAILASEGVLRAETLRFADEVRGRDDVGLERPPKPSSRALERMEEAVQRLAADAIPLGPFHDARSEAIESLARAKRQRGEDVVERATDDTADGERGDAAWEPPDLVALLKRRLAETQREENERAAAPNPPETRSKSELYARAKELGIEGRSAMTKDDLARAIARAERP
jgi:DNA end-binding protein Ku